MGQSCAKASPAEDEVDVRAKGIAEVKAQYEQKLAAEKEKNAELKSTNHALEMKVENLTRQLAAARTQPSTSNKPDPEPASEPASEPAVGQLTRQTSAATQLAETAGVIAVGSRVHKSTYEQPMKAWAESADALLPKQVLLNQGRRSNVGPPIPI